MKDKKQLSYDQPWDPSYYETGRTAPPKKRSGCLMVSLAAVIFLGGLLTALGLMNIRLFTMGREQPDYRTSIGFQTVPTTAPQEEADPGQFTPETVEIHLDGIPSETQPEDVAIPYHDIFNATVNSLVSISTETFRGNGVILTADGYIVTTCQVVDGASVIRVQLYDGRTFDATPVGQDSYADIAVIKIAATDLAPGVFGQSDILKQGDPVIAIGSPSNTSEQYRYIMNSGILSGMRNAADRQQPLLLSNATLPGDNIGCPLLNRHGQIIGIHTQALRPAGIEGLRSAIPSTTVKEAAEQLIRIRNNGRPSLGLTGSFLSTLDALYYRLPYGFYITAVAPDSDAAVKGIRPGDILTEFAGESVTDINQLKNRLYRYSIGDTVGVTIYRNGEELFLELTLTESHEEP